MDIIKAIILIIIFTVLLSGCIEETDKRVPPPSKGTPTPTEDIPKGEQTPQRIFDNAKDITGIAKQDLATKINVPEDEIKVDAIIPVEWADTSLGYPEPNKKYDFDTIPGYVILLVAKGKLYEYHSDRYKTIVPPSGPIENLEDMPRVISNRTDGIFRLVDLAKKDLANRLQIPIENIRLIKIVPKEWPDTSLGYPKPNESYAQVIVKGFIILLEANGKVYEYHSGSDNIVPPPDIAN